MCAPALSDHPETLAFSIDDGPTHNAFYRRGPIAAHLVVSSGRAPRVLVAFPAGNTGAGLWFEPLAMPAELAIVRAPEPVLRDGGLRGISATLRCDAPELHLRGAVLGSVRALRRFARGGDLPPSHHVSIEARTPVVIQRTTLDRRHRVLVEITPHDGAVARLDGDRLVLAARGGPLRFTMVALADDAPLTPIAARDLLIPGVSADPRALSALAFLSYEEKLLAGSWRFLTYFGRDTLLTLRLLAPVLKPAVVEAGLGAVLDRLSSNGIVAHEEAIGDEATAHHLAQGALPDDPREPVLDHAMIDDDFLLAPVIADYLLDRAHPDRARAFLARRTPAGETYAAALAKNLAFVTRRALPFAEAPAAATLIGIPDGRITGDWRDSTEGLGGGRTPFGVNAALVPAALHAAARLRESALLDGDAAAAGRLRNLAHRYDRAADLFRVSIPRDEAHRRLAAYAASIDLDPANAIASITGDVTFPGVALAEGGAPIPVMSSDDGFILLFGEPSPAAVEEAAARVLRPFPAGLRTPIGILVANPAFCPDPATRALFTAGHYHGTVVWSWQQALLAAGLDRQLARADLPPPPAPPPPRPAPPSVTPFAPPPIGEPPSYGASPTATAPSTTCPSARPRDTIRSPTRCSSGARWRWLLRSDALTAKHASTNTRIRLSLDGRESLSRPSTSLHSSGVPAPDPPELRGGRGPCGRRGPATARGFGPRGGMMLASRTRCTSVRNTRFKPASISGASPQSVSAAATDSSVETNSRLGSARRRP
ncbi:Glycogen debranching enzyme [Minicystis rosea]|nr:Glycogen debranching enzyme [Minicystis rosea]